MINVFDKALPPPHVLITGLLRLEGGPALNAVTLRRPLTEPVEPVRQTAQRGGVRGRRAVSGGRRTVRLLVIGGEAEDAVHDGAAVSTADTRVVEAVVPPLAIERQHRADTTVKTDGGEVATRRRGRHRRLMQQRTEPAEVTVKF